MRILFMGTPDFAKESLEALFDAGFEIVGVVTNIDKPKGRGMKMQMSPVKEYAISKNLPIFQPVKVRGNTEFYEQIKALKPDLMCVVAYGKILPQNILDIPNLGAVNVHGSLLPKYRGAAPIQWSVINGDKVTGITTMFMNAGMDTGDIILKEEVEIGEDETTGELWEKLSKVGANLLVKTAREIENKTVKRTPQPLEGTMAPMISKEMSKINWNEITALQIKNLVRGLNPIMGAYSMLNGKKIKFWKVDILNKEKNLEIKEYNNNLDMALPGTVLLANAKKGLFIKTIDGIIEILEIQGENSRKMNIGDFLRGNKIEEGSIFE